MLPVFTNQIYLKYFHTDPNDRNNSNGNYIMRKLLIILTVNRICEKILDIIPVLAKQYKIDIYNVGEMSSKSPWYGDCDPREKWGSLYF